ncbi:MAG: coproporphyrinogen dehydrogenase HemZ [Oscillospiraceae bacterium]|jgi:oxygen-independent coproporphyrinogen-3 oxidase|nr:coproporphyrinogen dehydrogenase HemZ [Oscillospiraceae bacterium]
MLLTGHNFRYAVEQISLSLFNRADVEGTSELSGGVAVTTLTVGGAVSSASELVSDINDAKAVQYALKISFYKAALPLLTEPPPWGAISGVKPAQLAMRGANLERDYYVSAERAELCRVAADYALAAKAALSADDVMLYVGIPFCPTRCAYCSFVSSSVEKSLKLIEPYLDALNREIISVSERVKTRGERVKALYIGGGTPTTLNAEQLKRLIDALREKFDLSDCVEFSVEAGRPDTITREKMLTLKDGGVNRVSVNPQTMRDEVLNLIGRRHSAQDTLDAYGIVREVGFSRVNMDFIAGLPGDTPDGFMDSVNIGLGLRPENLTLHTLTRKRGSDLNAEYAVTAEQPLGTEVKQMLDYAFGELRLREYSPYYLYRQKYSIGGFENTGWTLPGCECLYNISMMEELCSVYALGAGGATKLITPNSARRVTRSFNKKYPLEYIAAYNAL